MPLLRTVSSALALSVLLPLLGVGTADAAFIRRSVVKQVTNANGSVNYRVATTVGNAVPFYTVTVEAVSPVGDDDITLEETDAWLHGAASLTALPTTDATVALTLYDTASASLMSFSGTLGADGRVTLAADTPRDADTACTSRTGCDTSDTTRAALDIEVLASEVFVGARGYDLGIDLAGADTYQVAYATITVTEGEEVTVCDGTSRVCTTTGGTTTRAEVGWDELGSVWEGDLTLAHEGLVELAVTARDAEGRRIETARSKVGTPWFDGGEGVGVLATDEDPLTTVGLLRCGGRPGRIDFDTVEFDCAEAPRGTARLAVASSGWTAGDAVPVDAEVELTNGETLTIPVNSYHRRATGFHLVYSNELRAGALDAGSRVIITGGDVVLADTSVLTMTDSTMCVSGGCFRLVEDPEEAGRYELSVSVYGLEATDLPDDLDLTVTFTDARGAELASEDLLVDFDDDITAVFASEVGFSEDPTGLELAGRVSLLDAPTRKGGQSTLAKGRFYAALSRDGDGDLSLAGADKDTVVPRGDALVAGEPLAIELSDTNDDGVLTPPPLAPMAADGQPVRYYTIELEAIVITN